MIEKIILDYLSTELNPIPVKMERMSTNEPYVVLEKIGGGESNHIKSATIAIQSYGASLYGAAELNESVKSAMEGARALNEIASCKLNADYNFTDTTTKSYRYQAVYDLVFY